jgi:glutathione S-transferase
MSVKIYLDYMSQPSRAVYAYCKAAEIPHEVIEVRIVSGDLRKPEFQKINPMRKVPAIEYKGFHLYESHAILVYLANKFGKAENLYPKDLEKRAVIDAYLHWHH